jgi:hypothetical protein
MSHLPEASRGFASQALNDVVGGGGKAVTGYPNLLHASAGKMNVGSCTLFFDRTTRDIVGIGEHIEVKQGQSPQYVLHWRTSGSGLPNKLKL